MLLRSDARTIPLADGCVQCIVTSPPYFGLRDYGLGDAGIGLESTLDGYIENMLQVGRELWRVLRDDGTLWLNLGDLHWGAGGVNNNSGITGRGIAPGSVTDERDGPRAYSQRWGKRNGLKPKDLVGLPWRVAFALQADGWYLRSDIIWHKPNPMPESVRDRPTRSHEFLFLLAKQQHYFYDAEAIKEPLISSDEVYLRAGKSVRENHAYGEVAGRPLGKKSFATVPSGRNRRTVWTIATQPYKGSHFATFPEKLVEPCILAGTSPKACGVCGAPWERVTERETIPVRPNFDGKHGKLPKSGERGERGGDSVDRAGNTAVATLGWCPTCHHNDDTGSCLVLDPFCGSGTVGVVAQRLGRRFMGLDLQPKYLELARERIAKAFEPPKQ